MVAISILTSYLDELLQNVCASQEPGLAVLLVKDGLPIYRRARGQANLEHQIPLTPDMPFRIGSITKPFTALAIMLLANEKKLNLTDPISRFLPDFPETATITLAHLLSHTSGIKNYVELPEWWVGHRQDLSPSELISLFKNQPLVSQPGTTWAYNNSGYVLLGAIIEAVTGQSYASFIEQRIFKPLHMQHSFYDSANRVTPLHVYGYQKTPDGFIQAEYLSMSQVYAAGALVSTLDDLVIWINALYNGKLIPADAFKLMTTPYRLNNGEPVAYGYGWSLNNHHGIPLIEHLGSLPGYISYMIGAPEQHLISIVLSNGDNLSQTPEQIARQMMAKVLD